LGSPTQKVKFKCESSSRGDCHVVGEEKSIRGKIKKRNPRL